MSDERKLTDQATGGADDSVEVKVFPQASDSESAESAGSSSTQKSVSKYISRYTVMVPREINLCIS